jgi:putative peptidoglycan lipid II flippase
MAHYLATSDAADAFAAAFRIPNFLQNLFGEGALSASFIPVYAGLLAREDREEADRTAGAVGTLLALAVAVLVLAGVLLAPVLVDLLTPGFEGAKRDLTVHLVRILYPGAGLLVLSAWCLGILNSHGRFFLSYAAPVIWNVAIIAALVLGGSGAGMFRLAEIAAWGSVVGSLLQLAVQLPPC